MRPRRPESNATSWGRGRSREAATGASTPPVRWRTSPSQRHTGLRAPRAGGGARRGEAGRRPRQPRSRPRRRAPRRRHRPGLPGRAGRAPRRPVRRRRDPGRRRHVDEHERQRGGRQPRARAPGPARRQLRRGASARPRQPQPEHQRRLPDGGEAEPARRARRALRRRPWPRGGMPGEVPGVLVGAQGRPHPAAGRGPDDGRAGVRCVGRDPGRGGGPHPRHARAAPGDQPRRDRDRHRHHRRSRLPRGGLPPAAGDHRTGAGHRAGPDRGHLRRRRLPPALRGAQEDRGQGLQDLQRPPAVVLGPPGRLRRAPPPATPGGLEHHAREGEPGDPGDGQPGGVLRWSATT